MTAAHGAIAQVAQDSFAGHVGFGPVLFQQIAGLW
jgi:hypothetical protein